MPLARRHGPIAEPARGLDAAGRQGQESRLDLRFADPLVVGRVHGRRWQWCGEAGTRSQDSQNDKSRAQCQGSRQHWMHFLFLQF